MQRPLITALACLFSVSVFGQECEFNSINIEVVGSDAEIGWNITQDNGWALVSGALGLYEDICLEDGCYPFNMYDGNGDGWMETIITISYSLTNEIIFSGTLEEGNFESLHIQIGDSIECPVGCTDPTASNYDAEATEDDGSCCYDDSFWEQVGPTIIGEQVGDFYSVDISSDGNIVAVGSYVTDNNSGHVRIYQNINTTWVQLGQDIDGEAEEDGSGIAVSLNTDGHIVAIGAPYNDGNGGSSGHVRIYNWDGTSWIQLGQDIDGEAAGDTSGYSVSLSSDGNTVAIGAVNNDGNGPSAGHVRIYNWDGTSWTQVGNDIDGELNTIDSMYGHQSGHSVSLSADANTVAIGGNGAYMSGEPNHVRIYNWDGASWIQIGNDIDGEEVGDSSGYSVSLSSDGNIVAVGAIHNEGGGVLTGHVRIYNWDGTSWIQLGQDIDGEAAGDNSGNSVSLSSDGNTVAIGAVNNDGNGPSAGHVRIYNWDGTSWIQLGQDIDGEAAGDNSGKSVSLSADGNTLSIVSPQNTIESGHVRVYELNTSCETTGLYYDGNGDGCVDVYDMLDILLEYGQCEPETQLDFDGNGDGCVNGTDILNILMEYGSCE